MLNNKKPLTLNIAELTDNVVIARIKLLCNQWHRLTLSTVINEGSTQNCYPKIVWHHALQHGTSFIQCIRKTWTTSTQSDFKPKTTPYLSTRTQTQFCYPYVLAQVCASHAWIPVITWDNNSIVSLHYLHKVVKTVTQPFDSAKLYVLFIDHAPGYLSKLYLSVYKNI